MGHYEEAECLNVLGNTQMQSRSFHAALATYTSALELMSSSLGAPNNNSHVYYSNRSAAHLGLNDYVASIEDSHKSLALQPKYAKAQLRLGLALQKGHTKRRWQVMRKRWRWRVGITNGAGFIWKR